ncbi:ABC transporter ATP-binding protein [Bifidobacterium scaligerum]|uniref:Peptide ABC transporter ATP-binding protein n=1 Tax=Bifidobacterium scaligerum TaxID=2052656 RepID=A0A2M9HN34_9BIFI|nr:dipeptide/oligopeptide/nickel ABC transporter ATP-binding protein [Bifidobacterium scaligerum]PJM78233.1 peptide ABC transporter ATP-binding protein [Bifidobacterium scaligerum]
MSSNPIFYGSHITKIFGDHTALDDVSFTVRQGMTLGVVGESGSGKSTLGKISLRLLHPNNGDIYFQGYPIWGMTPTQIREMRLHVQLIPQDPKNALNPAKTVWQSLCFHMAAQKVERRRWRDVAVDSLAKVALGPEYLEAYPAELSGGQAQRIAIARAISSRPDVLVCDEAVSSLDKSVQAQVLNVLCRLQQEMGLSLFFITHDLNVVDYMCDDVLVLNNGHVVESGNTREILDHPQDAYTRELLTAKEGAIREVES